MAIKNIDPNTLISVESNVEGDLIYESDRFADEWNGKGDVLEIPFEELQDIRRRKRKFYENNWLIIHPTEEFTDVDIYTALGVLKFYPEKPIEADLDKIVDMKPAQLAKYIGSLNDSRKEEIASYVRGLVEAEDKRVDSKSKLNALSKALGVDFSEV